LNAVQKSHRALCLVLAGRWVLHIMHFAVAFRLLLLLFLTAHKTVLWHYHSVVTEFYSDPCYKAAC
jgi:hypothetical protein